MKRLERIINKTFRHFINESVYKSGEFDSRSNKEKLLDDQNPYFDTNLEQGEINQELYNAWQRENSHPTVTIKDMGNYVDSFMHNHNLDKEWFDDEPIKKPKPKTPKKNRVSKQNIHKTEQVPLPTQPKNDEPYEQKYKAAVRKEKHNLKTKNKTKTRTIYELPTSHSNEGENGVISVKNLPSIFRNAALSAKNRNSLRQYAYGVPLTTPSLKRHFTNAIHKLEKCGYDVDSIIAALQKQ